MIRIGHGYDVHATAKDRKLVLGGVFIECGFGLDGHSDADVLIHAVCDAIIGALGQGDIGKHFPDTDDKYKGIYSMLLLENVCLLMKKHSFKLVNIDATVIAQAPKLAPHIPMMKRNIASVLGVAPFCINVKATTEEHLGFTGKGEGIAAHAVCLIESV